MDRQKPNLRDSDYFGAMNQRKQEPRAFACFGAMHLNDQPGFKIVAQVEIWRM